MKSGRNKDSELDQLQRGLEQAKPLDDLIRTLRERNSAEDLYGRGSYYLKWTGHMMAIAGIYFLALKDKLEHGSFKKFFSGKTRPVSYMHAWQCMKAAEVVAAHSVFGHLRSSRAFLNLLLLPAPEREAIADQMKDVSDEEIAELLPDKIQKRYDEIKTQRRQEKNAKEKDRRAAVKSDEIIPPTVQKAVEESQDEEWMSWLTEYTKLRILAERFSKRPIKPEWFDRIIEREMVRPLSKSMAEIVNQMHPIEEVRKRAKIVHAPGFTR